MCIVLATQEAEGGGSLVSRSARPVRTTQRTHSTLSLLVVLGFELRTLCLLGMDYLGESLYPASKNKTKTIMEQG
jgi:hypothetical protein